MSETNEDGKPESVYQIRGIWPFASQPGTSPFEYLRQLVRTHVTVEPESDFARSALGRSSPYHGVPRSPPWPGQLSDWVVAQPCRLWLDPEQIGQPERAVELTPGTHLGYEQFYWLLDRSLEERIDQFRVRDGEFPGRRAFIKEGTPWAHGLVRDPAEMAPPAGLPAGGALAAMQARTRLATPGSRWRTTCDFIWALPRRVILEAGEVLCLEQVEIQQEEQAEFRLPHGSDCLFRVLQGPHAGAPMATYVAWQGDRPVGSETRQLLELLEAV